MSSHGLFTWSQIPEMKRSIKWLWGIEISYETKQAHAVFVVTTSLPGSWYSLILISHFRLRLIRETGLKQTPLIAYGTVTYVPLKRSKSFLELFSLVCFKTICNSQSTFGENLIKILNICRVIGDRLCYQTIDYIPLLIKASATLIVPMVTVAQVFSG